MSDRDICNTSTIDFIRCKLHLKKRVTDMKKLRKDVEIQNQLDSIPVWRKLLDPPVWMVWALSFPLGMIFGIFLIEELCK